jgi:hypothetical protein
LEHSLIVVLWNLSFELAEWWGKLQEKNSHRSHICLSIGMWLLVGWMVLISVSFVGHTKREFDDKSVIMSMLILPQRNFKYNTKD